MLIDVDFAYLINASIGILFSVIIGFFILKAILSAIAFATDYEGKKETLENAKKSLTAAVKGIIIALGTFLFLNFILSLLGIAPIYNPGTFFEETLDELYVCLYNYSLCGLPGVDIRNLPENLRYAVEPYNSIIYVQNNPTYLSSYDFSADPDRLLGPLPPPGSAIRPVVDANGVETTTANYFALFSYGRSTHHLGMTQWGARARATAGQKYQDIIKFYYASEIDRPEICPFGKRNKKLSDVRITVIDRAKNIVAQNLDIETYLYGVHKEMPPTYGTEALKSQALAARSYALWKTRCGEVPICNYDACQTYLTSPPNNEWKAAVDNTKFQIIKDNDGITNFQYSAYSGGYVYPGGFDLDESVPNPKWPDNAYEKKSMVANGAGKSFYATWLGGGLYKSVDDNPGSTSCPSLLDTYLDAETWADFANVNDIYSQKYYELGEKQAGAWLATIRADGCNYIGKNILQLRAESPKKHTRVTSIVLERNFGTADIRYTPNQIASNSTVKLITDKGESIMKVKTFRLIYNTRARGSLSLSSDIIAFEGK